jgi:hypothetical protein
VKFDLDTVRKVVARFVDHYVPARHQKQAFVTLEEKAARIRQQPLLLRVQTRAAGAALTYPYARSLHRCEQPVRIEIPVGFAIVGKARHVPMTDQMRISLPNWRATSDVDNAIAIAL